MYKKKKFLDALVRNRFRSNRDIDRILSRHERQMRRPRPSHLKGVYNGTFFNIKVPPRRNVLPEIPKLPSPTGSAPKPFQSVPKQESSHAASGGAAGEEAAFHKQEVYREFLYRLREWWTRNWAIMVMNGGSFCTLMAFTRSDVLELRSLSVTGSLCFLVYNFAQPAYNWLTIGWTSLFALVNTQKIIKIINERHSDVKMTEEHERYFVQYFMMHGVTPKQFDQIQKNAERIQVKKNDPIIKQGERLEHVYLVVEGSTRASILGRYLTAASTSPLKQEAREGGGNAGAWVGEMSFLESFFEKEQGPMKGEDGESETKAIPLSNRSIHAMYTVVAKENCVVWRWSHDDMERLMNQSTDFRSALTRAMTAAIVGKVINFTVSRTSARPTWQTWLDDWKHTRVSVKDDDEQEGDDNEPSNAKEHGEDNRGRDLTPA